MLDYGWRIDANTAWLRAKYDDFVQSATADAVNFAGNVPVNVPQNVSNIWLTWAFAPDWSVNGGVQIVGKTFADNANTLTRPAYTVVNAGAAVEAGCEDVAVSGIWIGILRVRLRRRYSTSRITPYRGWMAWHHVTGFFAGVFVLTWMFSGWLSLNPGGFFAGRGPSREMLQRYASHDAPSMAAEWLSRPPAAAVEARFVWLGGKPLMLLSDRSGRQTSIDPATGMAAPLSDAAIFEAARQLMPQAAMTMQRRLDQYDAYWYAHHQPRALPVLRAGFDDAAQTWFHIDPRSGEILGRSNSSRRSYRWLFNALHSFDFPLLVAWRPAWDIVMWLLSMLGLTISVSGIVIGWRRLVR